MQKELCRWIKKNWGWARLLDAYSFCTLLNQFFKKDGQQTKRNIQTTRISR